MRQFLAIIQATFREAVRNKILYSILFFAIVLILLALAMGSASLRQEARLINDIGLFALHFFSDVIAIFIGVTMVHQEIERKTIYNVLSKPVSRHTYFMGKFVGMGLTLLVQLAIMGTVLVSVLIFRGGSASTTLFYALALTWVECLIVLAVALFFSSFSTPYVSGFLTLGVWVVGSLVPNLEATLSRMDPGLQATLAKGIVAFAPDFSFFTLTTQLTYDIPVTFGYFLHAGSYGLSYAALLLVTGSLIFSRRDFI